MEESTEIDPVRLDTPVVVSSVAHRFGDRRRSSAGTPVDLGALVQLVPQIIEMLSRSDELVRIVEEPLVMHRREAE